MSGVPIWMFEEAKKKMYGMAIGSWGYNRYITSIYVPMIGIRGGGDSANKVQYQLFIDLDKFFDAIPTVFVLRPEDREIRHCNIYPAGHTFCTKLNRDLPQLCHGQYADTWRALGDKKNLLVFLNHCQDLLNHENFSSPARRV